MSLGNNYCLPPKEIRVIVDVPPLTVQSFSPHHVKILFLERRSLLPLSELARPEEKLVGLRIDGSYNARSRMSFYPGLGIHSLLDVDTLGPEKMVRGFPDGAKINFVSWSFYPGLGIHSLLDVGTLGPEKKVRGFPDGAKINFVSCVRKGKWPINWRPDKPSTLYWVETQDGGDAKVEPSPCYIVYVEPVEPGTW